MKVLILKRDKVGDLLLATPMLAHLRRSLPKAEIHLLANDYNAWVVDGNRDIDRLWVYPRFKHGARLRWGALWAQLTQVQTLRRERFDFAIAAGGVVSPRAVLRVLRLNARRSIAYAAEGEPYRRLTDSLTLPLGIHEVEANLRLLQPLGVPLPARPIYPHYELPERWRAFGKAWLAERGLAIGGFIVLGLNARRVKRKPSRDQILRWAAAVKREWGLDTVLIWQPGEANDRLYPGDDALAGPIIAALPKYLHPFRDELGVHRALGIVWHARAAAFPDGGIAHLAAASPAGVVSLFAETEVSPHPDNWRPFSPRGLYLEARMSVTEISDAQVLGALERLVRSYPEAVH